MASIALLSSHKLQRSFLASVSPKADVKGLDGKLTETKIKEWWENETSSTLFDNSCLHLVRRRKCPRWMLRFHLQGQKPTMMSLGMYSRDGVAGMSLRQSRELYYYTLLPLIQQGLNPQTELIKVHTENTRKSTTLFKWICEEWLDEKIHGGKWKNQSYASKVKGRMKNYVYPFLGKMSCDSITELDIQRGVLSPILCKGCYETSRLVFRYLQDIFDDLEIQRLITHNPMRATKKWLSKRLPNASDESNANHLPAVETWDEVGEILHRFEVSRHSYKTYVVHLLVVFTVARMNNIIGCRWSHIHNLDSKNPFWLIPRDELKKHHVDLRVPLCKQLVQVLRDYREWCSKMRVDSDFLFPSKTTPTGHIRPENLEKIYRDTLGLRDRHTLHGWRSSFSILCNNHNSGWNRAIELCLHHHIGSRVERAYNHPRVDELMEERRAIYQWWGDTLEDVWNEARKRHEEESKQTTTVTKKS